jgi:hypothetical protein
MKYFLPFFLLISHHLSAQTEYYRRNVSSLHISQLWMPKSELKNTDDKFALPQSHLSFVVPLIQKRHEHNTTAIPSYMRLQLQGGILYTPLSLDRFKHTHSFLQPYIGLGGAWYKGNRNLFLANATAMISEDNYTLLKPQLRGRGSLIFKRLPAPKAHFSYMLGMGYSYIWGTGRIFPIVGVKGSLNPARTFRYDVIFPTHAKIRFVPNPKQSYAVFLRLNGNAYRFENQDSTANIPNVVIFRNRHIQAGLSAAYAFSRQLKVQVEAGGLFLRHIGLSDVKKRGQKVNYYFSDNPTIAVFVKLGVSVYLQQRKENEDLQWEYGGE